MPFCAFIFLLFTHLAEGPKRICLPIQVPKNSPVEFALNTLRDDMEQHRSMIEASCSQPDFQLFYSIDKSLKNEDDFILIISDVNIEISAGSERGVMYGILEFSHQLRASDYEISNVRSVVSHPNTKIRGIIIDHKYLTGPDTSQDWNVFLDEMVTLRFNHLVVSNKANSSEVDQPMNQEAAAALKRLARIRDVGFEIQDFSTDTLNKKGLVVNSGTVSRALFSKAAFRINKSRSDFVRLSKIREYPTIIIEVDGNQIHNLSNWQQHQWWRIFSDRKRVPQRVFLDCTGPELYKDSFDFLVRHHRYFANWSMQLEQPLDFLPLSLVLQTDQCFSLQFQNRIQAAEKASRILVDCLSKEKEWFDWRSFQRIDKLNQGRFYGIQEMYDDLRREDFSKSDGKRSVKISIPSAIDSLRILRDEIGDFDDNDCDHRELGFLLADLRDFATCLSYAIHKLESAQQLSNYTDQKKRHYKVQAISQINIASSIWEQRWSETNVKDGPYAISSAKLIEEGKHDVEVVKKFKN